MSLAAATILEVRPGGSDTNGGGFVTGAAGTNWSLQDAAQYAVTDGVTNGTTTITSASAAFGTDVIGNIIYVAGGTGSVAGNWYQITARPSTTSITVDRTTGLTAGTGVTLNIGGALASPGKAGGIMNAVGLAGIMTYLKYSATPYSITSVTAGAAGGALIFNNTGTSSIVGYDTTRTPLNMDANRPTIQVNVSTCTVMPTGAGNLGFCRNIIFDGNLQTSARLINAVLSLERCKIIKFNTVSVGLAAYNCGATLNSATVFPGTSVDCEAYANSSTPFSSTTNNCPFIRCLSYNNTGASSGFASTASVTPIMINCTAYGNALSGFLFNNLRNGLFENNLSVNNGLYGFDFTNATNQCFSKNNMTYNNNFAPSNGTVSVIGGGELSGDPFTDAANGDFSLNNIAGAGAACRDIAYPSVFPAGLTASYGDVGVAQHLDSGGSGGPVARQNIIARGTPF